MTTVAEANAERWFKKVRGEGRAEAMYLMVVRRFGPETATMLIERFGVPDEPNRLVDIGEWIHECKTGDDLLGKRTTGMDPSGRGARPRIRVEQNFRA